MKYKLLGNKKGIILTRNPEIIENELEVSFVDAPVGCIAIFENSEGDLDYRELEDKVCLLSSNFLNGVIRVTLAVFDDTSHPTKWMCEEIVAQKLKDGSTLIMPNDMNMPQKFVEVQLELEKITEYISKLEKRIKMMEDKFEAVFEGHNYI